MRSRVDRGGNWSRVTAAGAVVEATVANTANAQAAKADTRTTFHSPRFQRLNTIIVAVVAESISSLAGSIALATAGVAWAICGNRVGSGSPSVKRAKPDPRTCCSHATPMRTVGRACMPGFTGRCFRCRSGGSDVAADVPRPAFVQPGQRIAGVISVRAAVLPAQRMDR